jgi:RNA recognition motif-containing protein
VTDDQLRELFASHGTIETANVVTDRHTNDSRGFGFVEFSSQEEAQAAIAALDGTEQFGRQLKVNMSRPRGDRSGGGGYRDRW